MGVFELERLAQWWAQAPEESRWLLLRQAIEGTSPKGPTLQEVHLAAYLAETDQGKAEVR